MCCSDPIGETSRDICQIVSLDDTGKLKCEPSRRVEDKRRSAARLASAALYGKLRDISPRRYPPANLDGAESRLEGESPHTQPIKPADARLIARDSLLAGS